MVPKSLDEALRIDPPCYPRACAIQTCLQKNNYDESRCTYLIDMLYECCAELYKREGSGAKNTNTTCCPKESLLRLKMKQRAEEKGGGAQVHDTRQR